MSGILIRPLAHEDGYATVAVVNAAGGHAVVDASGRVRLARYLPPGTEQVVGVDGSGAVVGYAYLAYREGLLVQETGGAVHPDRQAAGVGGALAGATVVGGLLANGKTAEQPGTGRIGSLFVLPEHRGRGIGQALTAFTAFRRRGITRVVVDTDTENPTGALRLYQRLGMRPYRRELVLERTVRSGREVRVITAKPDTAHP